MAAESGDSDGFLDRIPKRHILVKDLSMAREYVPGNPFSRFDTETKQRKYCSASLFEKADEKYIIPDDSKLPVPLVVCECCEKDSYRTDDDSCGRCGEPMFDCPKCGSEIHGKPSECPECGAGYKWGGGD